MEIISFYVTILIASLLYLSHYFQCSHQDASNNRRTVQQLHGQERNAFTTVLTLFSLMGEAGVHSFVNGRASLQIMCYVLCKMMFVFRFQI